MNTYAAQIVDGIVTQVIVGDAAWAVERLGGVWVDTEDLVGIGWTFEDGTFTPPPPPVVEDESDTLDS